jgi:geranylgeranyl diphosphate synthase type I
MFVEPFIQTMLPPLEERLKSIVAGINGQDFAEMYSMLTYHMGWEGKGAGPDARGKRIRPLLVLLTNASTGGTWQIAIPAAAAVELVHNFSLIHDDIQDNSTLRRGRETVWKIWGIPQAINTGDAMFTLAHLAVHELDQSVSPQVQLSAARILLNACLQLTQGQYLDMSYEARGDLTVEAYWPMVSGKTAALIAACTELGAIIAGADPERCECFRQFGRLLGLAFQAQDDLLGIWGDAALTGKSAESDLVSGKKSLPVLYGLSNRQDFAARWAKGAITASEVSILAGLLESEGARAATLAHANQLTDQALQTLDQADPQGEAGQALRELAGILLDRKA